MSEKLNEYQIPSELIPSDPRFGCGPSLVLSESLERLAETKNTLLGTSHRKPAIKNLVKSIQQGLLDYFNLNESYKVVIGNGGATFLFDAIGLGLVKKSSAHFVCGEFSSKWYKAHKNIPWIETTLEEVEFGKGINPRSIEGVDTICCTLNETSTGVIINHLPEVDESTLLCVDATSGAGQVACDVSKVDVFFFSPQKVFASEGGTFIAILSEKAVKRIEEVKQMTNRYIPDIMNWKVHLDNSEKNQTYTTPSVSTLFLLDEQVKLMNKVGYLDILEEGKKRAQLLYSWADSKSYLSPYIKEDEFRSTSVATIDVDDQVDVSLILDKLYKEKVVFDISSYRKLGRNQFRISLFYNIKYEDLEKLTKLLSHMIEDLYEL